MSLLDIPYLASIVLLMTISGTGVGGCFYIRAIDILKSKKIEGPGGEGGGPPPRAPNGYTHCIVDTPIDGPGRHLEVIMNADGRPFSNKETFRDCVLKCYKTENCVGANYENARKRCFLKRAITPKTALVDSGWTSCIMVVLDEKGNVIEIPDSYVPTDEEELRLQLFGEGGREDLLSRKQSAGSIQTVVQANPLSTEDPNNEDDFEKVELIPAAEDETDEYEDEDVAEGNSSGRGEFVYGFAVGRKSDGSPAAIIGKTLK